MSIVTHDVVLQDECIGTIEPLRSMSSPADDAIPIGNAAKEGTANQALPVHSQTLYQALNKLEKEIRIVYLLPGRWDEPIRCVLKTLPLSKIEGEYETLSYAWDAESGFRDIIVNGQSCSVKMNLFLALRRLRKSTKTRIMWADALCIDQASSEEKSHQVALMRDIYQSCARVYLWLGDFPNDVCDRRTIEDGILGEIGDGPKSLMKQDAMFQAFQFLHELSADRHLCDLSCYDKGKLERPFNGPALEAFIALMSSSWWDRMWVIQEIVLPPSAIVICGSISASWQTISTAMNNAIRHSKQCCVKYWNQLRRRENKAMLKMMRRTRALSQTRDRAPSWLHFYRLLVSHRYRRATNPRDMVYGISALAPCFAEELLPDYSLTKEQVYQKLAIFLIQKQQKLHVLRGQKELKDGFSSWVYDWSSVTDDRLCHLENMRLETELYRASKKYKPVMQTRDNHLFLEGVFFDYVTEIGVLCKNSPLERSDAVWQWYELCVKGAKPLPISAWRDDFLRTMTGDVAYDLNAEGNWKIGKRAPAEQQDVFDEWFEFRKRPTQWTDTGNEAVDMFDNLVKTMVTGMSFFLTKKGYMGLGNPVLGDEVWVLLGGDVPFLLRGDANSTQHVLVGDCFVHGIMDGEALDYLERDKRTVELI